MIDNEEIELAEPLINDIIPNGWITRLLYVYMMLVIPVISFGVTFPSNSAFAAYQFDRDFDAYSSIMLSGSVTPYFSLFILWPMVSMVLLLYDANRYASYFWVRWGIYSGVIVGLHYSLWIKISLIVGLVTYFILMGVAYVIDNDHPSAWRELIQVIIFITIIIIVVLNVYIIYIFVVFGLLSLSSGPMWCTCVCFSISRRLYRCYEKKPLNLLHKISITWLSGYVVAWRLAMIKATEIYNSLPPDPPDCYIATAAAQGHPKLVGSRPVSLGEGRVMWVNPQLQYLKAGELILLATWPRGHQQVRRVYDVIGPKIARRLRHPILADMAYLSLLPLEWSVRGLLSFSPQLNALAQRLYI